VSRSARCLVPPAVAAALLLLAGCGSAEVAATVNGTKISREHVEGVLDHAKEEFGREGKTFPEPGTVEYRQLRSQALALLVYREELEQSAKQLGVTVEQRAIEER
jgi:hypothetical protein